VIQTEPSALRHGPRAATFDQLDEDAIIAVCSERSTSVMLFRDAQAEHLLIVRKRPIDVADLQPDAPEVGRVRQAAIGGGFAVTQRFSQ
jgi:hypothetical protein